MSRIQHISVKGLFGFFDHEVSLNSKDRITIIHGPNGYGKTTLLTLIDEIFNGSILLKAFTIPFRTLELTFDTGSKLTIKKMAESNSRKKSSKKNKRELLIKISKQSEADPKEIRLSMHDKVDRVPSHLIERIIPELEAIGEDSWLHGPTGAMLDFVEVIERYGDVLLSSELPFSKHFFYKDFDELRKSLHVSVNFIKTERLQKLDRTRRKNFDSALSLQSAVNVYSLELVKMIRETLSEYADISQSLDRSFPSRLVNVDFEKSLSTDEIKEELMELEKRRSRLIDAGLLEDDNPLPLEIAVTDIEQNKRNILSVYVQDVRKKLEIFDNLATKIELLKSIINQRFLNKKMTVNKESGFIVSSKDTNEALSPAMLSSGEQHELVLLYEMLFKTKPNSLILIDEPEISLHIVWQESFLSDLLDIAKLAELDVLMATHSPFIINDRWDLTVELKKPANERTSKQS